VYRLARTRSKSTARLARMFVHSESGNWGHLVKLMSVDLACLGSREIFLRRAMVLRKDSGRHARLMSSWMTHGKDLRSILDLVGSSSSDSGVMLLHRLCGLGVTLRDTDKGESGRRCFSPDLGVGSVLAGSLG
jgi:hypothetical protein